MNKNEIIPAIIREHKLNKKQSFPDHVVAQTAMIGQEFGYLQIHAIELKYGKDHGDWFDIEQERKHIEQAAIKTAAACIRFLEEFNH